MVRGIRGRVLLAFLLLLLALLAPLGLVLAREARRDAAEALDNRLLLEAGALTSGRASLLQGPAPESAFQDLARSVLQAGDGVTVLSGSIVIYASDPDQGAQAAKAPEVRQALAGDVARAVRPGPRTGKSELHLAVPLVVGETVVGAVRVTAPRGPLEDAERAVIARVAMGGGGAALAALLLAALLTGPLLASIRQLTSVARRLAAGVLSERADLGTEPDTQDLSEAINEMAASLERQVRDSYQERDTFGAVIHTMGDALLVTDDSGIVTLINPAATEIFGTTATAAMGKSFMEIVRDHEMAEVHRKALAEGRHQMGQVEHGRDLRLLRVTATPIQEKDKVSVLVIMQDLTDIKRLQVMRREFVANVSHELRTPLAAIKASVEAMEAGALDTPSLAKDFLSRIGAEVDELTEMAQRLLSLTKVETGQAPLSLGALDIVKAAGAVVDRLQPQARRQDLSLVADFPQGLPEVMADESSVNEVLLNLLGNAIKYTPPSGAIRLSAKSGDGLVEVTVEDTGEGIGADQLPHIFERFYKADRSRSSEGVGLGLALAKHLVQAQGGLIWAESTPGKGSVFHFALPVATQDVPDAEGD